MADENTTDAGVIPALGDAGPSPVITTKGKVWVVGHPTQKAKGELELLVVQVAVANLERLKPVLSKTSYETKVAALDAKIEGGHWKTWGTLWTQINNSPDSQPLFLASLLKQAHPDVTLADATKLWLEESRQVKHALAITVPPFFKLLVEAAPATPEEREILAAQATAEFLVSLTRTLVEPTE